MATYTIRLADKGKDLPGVEESEAEGGSVMRWPADQTKLLPHGVEQRDPNTGTALTVPWHRISFVRLGP
jgi:hypothetical protein